MSFLVKYVKDPGILTAAVKILTLKINSKRYLSSYRNSSVSAVEKDASLNSIIDKFPPPPKELLVFVYKPKEDAKSFLLYYLEKQLISHFTNVTYTSFLTTFRNTVSLKHTLFSFYFDKNYTADINLNSLLRSNTLLPDTLRFYLLSFELDPSSFSSLLTRWLTKYISIIEKEYLPKLKDFPLDVNSVKSAFSYEYPDYRHDFTTQPLAYSLCPIIHGFLYVHSSSKDAWLIAGSNFSDIAKLLPNNSGSINLSKIFEALSDPSRVKIIDYLNSHEGASRQTLVRILSIPASSAHHHLEKLKNAGLIKQQKQSTANVYSLNYPVYQDLSNIFKTYSQGGSYYENLETSPSSIP